MSFYKSLGNFLEHKTTKGLVEIFFRTKGFYAVFSMLIILLITSLDSPFLYKIFLEIANNWKDPFTKKIIEITAEAFLGYDHIQLIISILLIFSVLYVRYIEVKFTKIVDKGLFEKIQLLCDELSLSEAKTILDIIKIDYSILKDEQKHEYHKLLGTYLFLAGKYLPENDGLNEFGREYLLAGKVYSSTDESKRILALGYLNTAQLKEAREVLEPLITTKTNDKIFSTYLCLIYEETKDFQLILNLTNDNDVLKNSKVVKKIIAKIAFQEKRYAMAKDIFLECLDEKNSLDDKLVYFMIFSDYFGELNGFNNISKSHRDELISFNDFLDQLMPKIEGKKLNGIEDNIYNLKAIIASSVFHDHENAIFYYRKIIGNNRHKLNGVTKMNLVISLINSGKDSLVQDAKPILEDIIEHFNDYLLELADNPNCHVLFQAYFLYFSNFISDNKLKSYQELIAFKIKYSKELDKINKRNINAVILLNYANASDKRGLIDEFLKEDDSIWNNTLAFKITSDRKYLDHAFEIYETGDSSDENANLHLGKFFVKIGDKEKAFNLIKKNLKDFSQDFYVELLFGLGIELGKASEVTQIIDNYENYNGGKETAFSQLLRSKFLELKGDQKGALAIVSSSRSLNTDINLLFRKGHLEFQLGMDAEFQKTVSEIMKISLDSLHEQNIIKYLEFAYYKDKNIVFYESYRLVQKQMISDAFRHELLGILFKVHFEVVIDPVEQISISEDSYVIVEDLDNFVQKGIVFDGFSRNLNADYVVDSNNPIYKNLIGKSRAEIIDNLFGSSLGIKTRHKIVSITNKYVVQVRGIFKNIEQFGGRMFHFDALDGANAFSKMMESSQDGRESREQVLNDLYNQSLLSFYSISKNHNDSYIEDYFRICEGEKFNLVLDIESLGINKFQLNGVVLDITSIITIFRLRQEHNVAKLKQQLFISQFTLNYFISEAQNKSPINIKYINEGEKQILVSDYAANIQKWLVDNCIVINTETVIINPQGDLEDFFGVPNYHSLLLAKESSLVLISDDNALRRFARNEDFQVISGGIILLMKILFVKEILSEEDFSIIGGKLRELHFIAPLDKI